MPDGSVYAEPGVLDFSDTTVNPATGSVNLRAKVPNPKHNLLPGMYVTLKASLGQQHKVLLVAQQAVFFLQSRGALRQRLLAVGGRGKEPVNPRLHPYAQHGKRRERDVV